MIRHMLTTLHSVFVRCVIFPNILVTNSFVVPSNLRGKTSPSSKQTRRVIKLVTPTIVHPRTIRWMFATRRLSFLETLMLKSIHSKHLVRVTRSPPSSPHYVGSNVVAATYSIPAPAQRGNSCLFPSFMSQRDTPIDYNEIGEDNTELPFSAARSCNSTNITKGMDRVAVVHTGLGCCHGRNATKAAIRAIRDAIDYNSVKIRTIIPGGV
jgi:hypothetical protein